MGLESCAHYNHSNEKLNRKMITKHNSGGKLHVRDLDNRASIEQISSQRYHTDESAPFAQPKARYGYESARNKGVIMMLEHANKKALENQDIYNNPHSKHSGHDLEYSNRKYYSNSQLNGKKNSKRSSVLTQSQR